MLKICPACKVNERRANRSYCKFCETIRSREYHRTHKVEESARHKVYVDTHREQVRAWDRRHMRRLKEQIFDMYGRVCDCLGCTEWHVEFMTIDHKLGGGRKHRDQGANDRTYYKSILAEGFRPDKYRTLCMNCNYSYGVKGYCPHNLK